MITQSEAWKKLQDDLGEKSFLIREPDFSYLAILKKTPAGNYLYCPYGPVADNPESFKKALKSLEDLGAGNQAIFCRIEPVNPEAIKLLPENSQKTKDLNPKETWVLDLDCTEDELKKKLPSRLMRYYKNRAKTGLTIEKSKNPDDIAHLIKLQNALASQKGINTFSEQYLRTEAAQPFSIIYLVHYQNPENDYPKEVVAAGLVFDDESTRYNLQGAQSEQGRKLHATGILTIGLILDAYKKHLKTFDFWGIAPEGAPANHPWAGFTKFKKTFAGTKVDYAGAYDIIYNPAKYKIYQTLRSLRRRLSWIFSLNVL